MSAAKILECDKQFSKCVREAAAWTCEKCGSEHEEGTSGLHCAHFHSRGKWGTRFDPNNVASLCYGCHSYLDRTPLEKIKWFTDHVGEGMIEILQQKANDTRHGMKKMKKEISAHYRAEHKRLKALRAEGVTGKLEVIGFN